MRTKLIVVLELLYGRVLKVFIEWVVICQWSIRVVDVFQLSPIVFEAFEKKRTQIRFICSAMEMALMILRSHRSIARWKPDFTSIFERVRGKTEVKYFCSFCLLHWKYGRQLFNSFWNFSIWISRYFAIKFAMIHWVIKSLTFYRSRIRKNFAIVLNRMYKASVFWLRQPAAWTLSCDVSNQHSCSWVKNSFFHLRFRRSCETRKKLSRFSVVASDYL